LRRLTAITAPRTRKPEVRPNAKATDPKLALPKLRDRLEKERGGTDRWHKRLVRTFHAYERQHRLVTRLHRRIAKLESA
jgi:hypothetical protein